MGAHFHHAPNCKPEADKYASMTSAEHVQSDFVLSFKYNLMHPTPFSRPRVGPYSGSMVSMSFILMEKTSVLHSHSNHAMTSK
eukprot:5566777-Ditylum_brightwellii.AAC.1